jgi:hypothetical protein
MPRSPILKLVPVPVFAETSRLAIELSTELGLIALFARAPVGLETT